MDKPIKMIVDRERVAQRRATSSAIGNLLMVVEENQGVFAAVLGERCVNQDMGSAGRHALCSLATQTFNLSRSALLVLRSGYAVQATVLARAVYESATTCLYLRRHPDAADNWLSGKPNQTRYASVSPNEIRGVLDEYASLRHFSPVEQRVFDDVRDSVPKLYGVLSNLSHAHYDAVRHQVYLDENKAIKWFSLGPDLDETVYTAYGYLTLACVNVFLIVLALELLLEFRQEHLMSWEQLTTTWERFFFAHGPAIGEQAKLLNQRFQAWTSTTVNGLGAT